MCYLMFMTLSQRVTSLELKVLRFVNQSLIAWRGLFCHLLVQARKQKLREGKCFSTENSEAAALFAK